MQQTRINQETNLLSVSRKGCSSLARGGSTEFFPNSNMVVQIVDIFLVGVRLSQGFLFQGKLRRWCVPSKKQRQPTLRALGMDGRTGMSPRIGIGVALKSKTDTKKPSKSKKSRSKKWAVQPPVESLGNSSYSWAGFFFALTLLDTELFTNSCRNA